MLRCRLLYCGWCVTSCCELVAQWRVLPCSVVWCVVDVCWCGDVSCCVVLCCDVMCCLVLGCDVSCVLYVVVCIVVLC